MTRENRFGRRSWPFSVRELATPGPRSVEARRYRTATRRHRRPRAPSTAAQISRSRDPPSVTIRSTSSAIDTGSTELRLTALRRPVVSWSGSRITSLVGLVDLGGTVARRPRRQGLVGELGVGSASATLRAHRAGRDARWCSSCRWRIATVSYDDPQPDDPPAKARPSTSFVRTRQRTALR